MKIFKKFQSMDTYQRWMLICVAVASILRIILIYFHWPYTESDEGNMGILAMNVAFQGDHPIFFYGAPYLGPLEGYAAAPLFYVFGTSLFALRLPLVLFFALFLVGIYYLTLLLYKNAKFALAMVILLGLGSPDMLFLQLRASGEYPEIEMFAVLMCLFALWLALKHADPHLRWKRPAVYGLLGLTIGLALWVDLLILPFVAAVGLFLVFFCWRDLLRWSGPSLLVGCIVGALPLIYYNVTAPWSQNSWFVLLKIRDEGTADLLAHHLTLLDKLAGTFFVALPMATGGAWNCPVSGMPLLGSPTPASLPCILIQGGWSTGYLLLGVIAACLTGYTIWHIHRRSRTDPVAEISAQERREELIRQYGRLLILVSLGLTLLLYALAPPPALTPDTSFRYLTCMVLAFPLLLWPLWQHLSGRGISWQNLARAAALLAVTAILLTGFLRTLIQIPASQTEFQRKETLVQELLSVGATRVYADYWTCNILTFLSKEKIICSALDDSLNPGYDRYLPYRAIVEAAPHPTYIFPASIPQAQAIEQRASQDSSHYRRYTFEGYVVYQTL